MCNNYPIKFKIKDFKPTRPFMDSEIRHSADYVGSFLYTKVPRRRVNCLLEELEKSLSEELNSSGSIESKHIQLNGGNVDTPMVKAAERCGLELNEIQRFLPAGLCLQLRPGYVTATTSDGSRSLVYPSQENGEYYEQKVQAVIGLKPSTLQHLGLSDVPVQTRTSSADAGIEGMPWQTHTRNTTFSTAAFMQTKFGSTKLKSNKRTPRITDFQLAQRNVFSSKSCLLMESNLQSSQPQQIYPHSYNGLQWQSGYTGERVSPYVCPNSDYLIDKCSRLEMSEIEPLLKKIFS